MGWQDREYARPAGGSGSFFRPGRSWLIGDSIVTTLVVVNVATYVVAQFFSRTLGPWIYGLGAMQAEAVLAGQVWRLVTAQYLHAGVGHLLINMLVLHFLGRPLERMWSWRKFFTVYTLCGLFGNLFFTLLAFRGVIHREMPAVGASGSIYGLLGIVAVLFPTATVWVYFLFPIKVRTAALIFGGLALWQIIERGSNYGGEACHLAGLVFGVWWALKGDAWWSGRSSSRWTSRFRRARPGRFTQKIADRRADEETIDRILKKVYDGGIHSLSEAEKLALQEATERQRQREAEAGRVDRL